MKNVCRLCCLALTACACCLAGCAEKNPNANVPKDRVAPAPEDLGKNPDYAKQFGSKK